MCVVCCSVNSAVTFEKLTKNLSPSMTDTKTKHPDPKTKADYEAVIRFYEEQLRESDDTLIGTKNTFYQTGQILQNQIKDLTDELNLTKKQLLDVSEGKGQVNALYTTLEQKLAKSESARNKLSELMSKFEVELVQKKVECANQLEQLNESEMAKITLMNEINRLTNELVRAKGTSIPTSASNKQY